MFMQTYYENVVTFLAHFAHSFPWYVALYLRKEKKKEDLAYIGEQLVTLVVVVSLTFSTSELN